MADIVETQAGGPAANPTCQQTQNDSEPAWDHTDRTHKTDNSAALIGAAVSNMLIQTSACRLNNFTEQNPNQRYASSNNKGWYQGYSKNNTLLTNIDCRGNSEVAEDLTLHVV